MNDIYPIKTVFLGTGWESVETLRALHEDKNFNVVFAITTSDKPVGRKQEMTPSDVKKYCLENNIPVVHTEKKKENYIKFAKKYKPDIAICKAFGEIIPKEFLEYPKYGCINIHFSILPKYRGAVPIQKAILDGEKETGISIMLMSEGLDEGDVLEIYKEKIKPDDTNTSLRQRLVKKSSDILIPLLKKWIAGEIQTEKQDNIKASYCWQKDISKENAQINWNSNPEYIERMVRAFLPWPIAWAKLPKSENKNISEKIMKIFKAELIDIPSEKEAGLLFVKDKNLLFSTIDPLRSLKLIEFQIEGRNKTNTKEFLNGIGRDMEKKFL